MHVFLTGATGFIGRYFVRALLDRGDRCTVVSRTGRHPWADARVTVVLGNPTQPGDWQRAVAGTDAVVNLAGERLVHPFRRWSGTRKAVLVEAMTKRGQACSAFQSRTKSQIEGSGTALSPWPDQRRQATSYG